MKILFLLLSVSLLVSLFLQNCKHELPADIKPIDTTGNPTTSDTCSGDTVYFVNEILPLIQSSCAKAGCHDAITRTEGLQFTDYANIMNGGKIKPGNPGGSDFYEVLVETGPKKLMPPPPASLTAEQKNAIRLWILQGAKNNGCQNGCDTTNVSYSKSIWPIFESTCRGCHSGSGASGGIRITDYTSLKTLVDNGKLVGVLGRKPPFPSMPPAGPLEACAQAKIEIWIKAGAPNN
ncbi:MAG: hypothetical protein ACI8ZN_001069 [Bacteroidia bacterium]|jgi:hypothetical protein